MYGPDAVERHEEREVVALVEAALARRTSRSRRPRSSPRRAGGARPNRSHQSIGAPTVVVKSDLGSSVSLKTLLSQPRFFSSTFGVTASGPKRQWAASQRSAVWPPDWAPAFAGAAISTTRARTQSAGQ